MLRYFVVVAILLLIDRLARMVSRRMADRQQVVAATDLIGLACKLGAVLLVALVVIQSGLNTIPRLRSRPSPLAARVKALETWQATHEQRHDSLRVVP